MEILPLEKHPGYGLECYCGIGAAALVDGRRRAIPAAVRREVIARDGSTCRHCGKAVKPRHRNPRLRLTLDHVIPYSLGGEDTVENLQVACLSCNARRGTREDVWR